MTGKNKLRLALAALALSLLQAKPAYAYVDPGTGGMLYQIVILVLGAVAAYFAILKRYVKGFFSRSKKRTDEDTPQQR